MVVGQPGAPMHDPTLWQPLALGTVAAQGLAPIPALVQTFVGSQWGHVKGFALHPSAKGLPIDPGAPPIGGRGEQLLQARGGGRHPRERRRLERRDRRLVAGGLERARERRREFVAGARREALPRAERRAARRRDRDLGREAHVSGAAADLDDPLHGVPGPVERPEGSVLQRGGAAARAGTDRAAQRTGLRADADGLGPGHALDAVRARLRRRRAGCRTEAPSRPRPDVVLGGAVARTAARAEASGLDAGVDIPADDRAGQKLGVVAGRNALALARRYFAGTVLR